MEGSFSRAFPLPYLLKRCTFFSMNDFDPVAELKKYKVHLIAMSAAIFSITLMLSLCGRNNSKGRGSARITPMPQPTEGILLDYSDPQLAEDRLLMPQPLVFYTRRAGTNLINFERAGYSLDEAQFEETYQIYEKRDPSLQTDR